MLCPEDLTKRYGRINFSTMQFLLADGSIYKPEGGGPDKYIRISKVFAYKDTVVEFEEDDFFPDPWIIRHQIIYIEYELLTCCN